MNKLSIINYALSTACLINHCTRFPFSSNKINSGQHNCATCNFGKSKHFAKHRHRKNSSKNRLTKQTHRGYSRFYVTERLINGQPT